MSEKNNELELHMAEGLKAIDRFTRPTRGSGCATEIGDIYNKYFYVECKMNRTRENIIIRYNEEWLKLNEELPLNTKKIPVIAKENKYGEKFVLMRSEDFFRLAEEAKGRTNGEY